MRDIIVMAVIGGWVLVVGQLGLIPARTTNTLLEIILIFVASSLLLRWAAVLLRGIKRHRAPTENQQA